jgi:hypothetical protein
MSKPCTLCGVTKPLSEFYAAPACKDGRAGQCKACVKVRARNHRLQNAERIRAYDRERAKLPHRVLERAERFLRYVEQHPERRAAHIAVGNAIRDGRLLKMDCAFCGEPKTIAHHHDYNKPLEVTWLCQPCHHRFHALELMARKAKAA